MILVSKCVKNIMIHAQFSFSKSKFENAIEFYIADN